MKVAIMTSLPAEWDMNVNACHQLKSLTNDFRQVNLQQNGICM